MIDVGDTGAGTGSRRRRLWRWTAVAAVALVAAAAFGWFVVLRDPGDPISVGEAVDRYREGEDTPATGEGEVGAPPPPGVYVYATSGSEGVDVLGGSEHTFPAETTITVTSTGDGCLSFRWAPLEQRWNEEVLCPGGEGDSWSRQRTTLYHSFFNQDESRSYTCDAAGVVPAPDDDGSLTWTCDSAGSDQSGESHEDGRGEILGVEEVTVDGEPRQALRVRYDAEVSGDTTGGSTVERWYALDRFPLVLREVRSADTASETVIGTVNYHEEVTLELASWEPRR